MKRSTVMVCCVLVMLFALNLFAQEKSASTYYAMWYYKIPQGKTAQFLALVKQWKPVEEELLKQGMTTGWSFYRVKYPSGSAREYDYVWINGYSDFGKTKGGYPKKVRIAAHPDWGQEEWDKFWAEVKEARDWVKGELWRVRDRITPAMGKYFQINYMKVPAGGGSEYRSVASDIHKPYHQAKQEEGYMAYWILSSIVFPWGTTYPYNHMTADVFEKYEDIRKPVPNEVYKKAHPDETKWDANSKRTIESRELVKRELWVLVDSNNPSTE
jgi:hypothetical protein